MTMEAHKIISKLHSLISKFTVSEALCYRERILTNILSNNNDHMTMEAHKIISKLHSLISKFTVSEALNILVLYYYKLCTLIWLY